MSKSIDIKIKAKAEGTGEIKKLEQQLSAIGKIDAFKKLKKDLESGRAAWVNAQAGVAKLANEIAATDKPTKDLSNRFKIAKKEAASLKTEFQKNQKSLQTLRGSLKDAGITTKNLNAEQQRLRASLDKTRAAATNAAKIDVAKKLLNVDSIKNAETEIKKLKSAYQTLASSGKLSTQQLAVAQQALKQKTKALRAETSKYATSIRRSRLASLAYATIISGTVLYSVSSLVKSLFNAGNQVIALEKAFKAIKGSTKAAAKELDYIRGVADKLGLEFYSAADSYKLIAAAAENTALKGAPLRKIFVGVSEASTALGLSADDTQGVLRALGQMMSKGKVQAEELRGQLGERLPGAFQIAADAMGMSTKELDKLMSDGLLFSEEFLPKFAKALHEKYGQAALDAADDSIAASNRFKTAWTDLKAGMANAGFLDAASGALKEFTKALKDPDVVENSKNVAQALSGIATAAGKLAKYAGLRSILGTFSQGIKLARQGLIDYDDFISAGFLERQKMVDAALKKMGGTADETAQLLKDKLVQKFKEVSEQTGLTIESMKDLEGHIASGAVSFDESAGVWVGAEKKKQEAIEETVSAAKAANRNLIGTQNQLAVFYTQTADLAIEKIKNQVANQEMAESEGAKKIVSINEAKYEKLLAFANENLENIKAIYGEDSVAYKLAIDEQKKVTKSLKDYKLQAYKEISAAYKNALKEQLSEEKRLVKEISDLREKADNQKLEREDEIREIRRRGMTEAAKQADLETQATEKLANARNALYSGEYDRAEKLAKQAKSIYNGLTDEKKAISGVEDAWELLSKTVEYQEQEKRKELKSTQDKIAALKKELKDLGEGVEVPIKAETSQAEADLRSIRSQLSALKDKTITITTVRKTVSENQTGGPILSAAGGAYVRRAGRLGGYGGGDKIRSLLEAGEFIIRKEAVAKYGSSFFSALNAMRLNMPDVQGAVRARIGGLISSLPVSRVPVPAFAAGGGVGPSETLVVRFQAGDVEAPVKITDPSSRAAMKKMAREMSRLRMIYGK